MYRKTEDFLKEWKYESASTVKVFGNITDEALDKNLGENMRNIGKLMWHITGSVTEMMNTAGLEVKGAEERSPRPSTVKEIIDAYERTSASLIEEVTKKWSDDRLTDMIPMYGETWTKGTTLSVLVTHQAHHRGQLTILMRLAGLKVPGVYGPAMEEWEALGLPPMQ